MSPAEADREPDRLAGVVVIVDVDARAYHSHHVLGSLGTCYAFTEGMYAAWEISHGPANCWRPFVLGDCEQRTEWVEMGSPGLDLVKP